MPIDDEAVREALRGVEDPEAGMSPPGRPKGEYRRAKHGGCLMNIVELGLVYGVEVAPGEVLVDLTMTTAACPMADLILEQAHDAVVAAVPEGTRVEVRLVWDPPWTPDRMTGIAREHFGWLPR